MRHFIKELATDVALTVAATIGAVLMLATIGAITHHSAPAPQPAHTTASKVVPCLTFLSHEAMVLNQVDHVGPVPATSFCPVA